MTSLPPSQHCDSIHVVRVESINAICTDCGQGLFGGEPCEHKIRRAHGRGERVARLGTCSKCDDHNNPCVCPQGCGCAGHGLVLEAAAMTGKQS